MAHFFYYTGIHTQPLRQPLLKQQSYSVNKCEFAIAAATMYFCGPSDRQSELKGYSQRIFTLVIAFSFLIQEVGL